MILKLHSRGKVKKFIICQINNGLGVFRLQDFCLDIVKGKAVSCLANWSFDASQILMILESVECAELQKYAVTPFGQFLSTLLGAWYEGHSVSIYIFVHMFYVWAHFCPLCCYFFLTLVNKKLLILFYCMCVIEVLEIVFVCCYSLRSVSVLSKCSIIYI